MAGQLVTALALSYAISGGLAVVTALGVPPEASWSGHSAARATTGVAGAFGKVIGGRLSHRRALDLAPTAPGAYLEPVVPPEGPHGPHRPEPVRRGR
ncbi:hypothetical protein [Streptomyces sp. NPDC056544]